MQYALMFFFVFKLSVLFGQEVINIDGINCGSHGNAQRVSEYRLNVYKNRYTLPNKSDYLDGISIYQLMSSRKEREFLIDKSVIITGYVFNVKPGGTETCNCKTKNKVFRDTHIELTPDEEHTGPQYRLIVEVTPRIRAIMAAKGIDWSTERLKATLIGHRVKVAGWLFYDREHENRAFSNNPNGKQNWRASCWEIHPITYIRLLD